MQKLETIRTCRSLPEASVVQSWLEARGVSCVVEDAVLEEDEASSTALAAVLQVPATETARARQLLEQYDAEAAEEQAEESEPEREWPWFWWDFGFRRLSRRWQLTWLWVVYLVLPAAMIVLLILDQDWLIWALAGLAAIELILLVGYFLEMALGRWWTRR